METIKYRNLTITLDKDGPYTYGYNEFDGTIGFLIRFFNSMDGFLSRNYTHDESFESRAIEIQKLVDDISDRHKHPRIKLGSKRRYNPNLCRCLSNSY